MALKIACVGEVMIELLATRAGHDLGFAGDALNTSVYLRRSLSPEHSVAFVSVVGQDPLSDQMLDFISGHHVATDGISRHPELLPGLYAITTDENGERSFIYWRENSAARTLFQNGFDELEDYDVILLSGITLAILPANVRDGLVDWLEKCSAQIVFDSNYRPRLWENADVARSTTERAWRSCDIALPSLDDELALFGDADEAGVLARLRGYGIKHGALKRGVSGPVSLASLDNETATFSMATNVVDTTAAGDSFNGAFLGCYLSGGSATEAMRAGHVRALEVIGKRGAIVPTSTTQVNI